ncbi:MAG TPA: winged helix-turn-helix domain-containing protein [Thermoanaerobaculia bacterium]|nr:winged helix-turn-helix domain-containing protein [Thermoanaerobaculia bacterium]
MTYEFGRFRVDATNRLLFRGGEEVPLGPKTVELLLLLIDKRGEILSKEQLMDALWPGQFVQEANLAQNVYMLRKEVGADHIVTVPRRGYRFAGDVKTRAAATTIAVLPFSDDDLGVGLADALITRLTNLASVVVRPTSAVRRYAQQRDVDIAAVGRELRVDHVLEGSIRRADDRLRIRVQLVRAADRVSLWAETFDENFTAIFDVEDRVADRVAAALAAKMTGDERRRLTRRATNDPAAYRLFLKGRYHAGKWTAESSRIALESFQEAIAIDPAFAPALCGWAEVRGALWFHGHVPAQETVPACKRAVLAALELEEDLPEAHITLAGFLCWHDWDFAAAEREFKRALAIAPHHAQAHDWYALFLKAMGRHEEAIRENTRALELDPLSLFTNASLAWAFYYARQYDRALEQCKAAAAIEPRFGITQWTLGIVYQQLGDHNRAIAALEQSVALTEYSRTMLASLGHAYAIADRREDALRILSQLQNHYVPPHEIALVHAGLGNHDEALAWLARALDERSAWVVYLNVDPRLDALRADGRFGGLVGRVGVGGDGA